MYKFVVLAALVACAVAAPGNLVAAPVVAAAPLAYAHTVPVATSYANTYKVSVKSPLVAAAPVAYTAPAYAHAAPLAYAAAPAYAHAAPLAYAAAPLAYAGYGAAYVH